MVSVAVEQRRGRLKGLQELRASGGSVPAVAPDGRIQLDWLLVARVGEPSPLGFGLEDSSGVPPT